MVRLLHAKNTCFWTVNTCPILKQNIATNVSVDTISLDNVKLEEGCD